MIIFLSGGRLNFDQGWFFFGRIYNQSGNLVKQTFLKSSNDPDILYKANGDNIEIYARVNFDYPYLSHLQITNNSISLEYYGTDATGLTPIFA